MCYEAMTQTGPIEWYLLKLSQAEMQINKMRDKAPASKAVILYNATLISQKKGFERGIDIFLSASSLNHGSDKVTNNNESIKANTTTKNIH
jgi:hypothetical protein